MSTIRVFAATVVAAALIGLAFTLTRSTGAGSVASRPEAAASAKPLRVVLGVRPSGSYDAGEVAQGGRVEVPFVVSNPGPAAVTVGPFRTSCDCLRVELDATRVEAGTEVGGRAVIDLANEPGFRGGLILSAEAEVSGNPRPLSIRLSLTVR
jgi:hypothetical protein